MQKQKKRGSEIHDQPIIRVADRQKQLTE